MDKETVYKLAKLAKIKLRDEEADVLTPQLGDIMSFIEQLNEVDTDEVETFSGFGLEPKMREDKMSDGGYPESVLVNTPEQAEGYFVVPKIIE